MSHWYDQEGNPKYEVNRAKGEGTRPTTLADARKLNLVPSVTTILSIIAKPMLEKWKQQQLLDAIFVNPFQYGDANFCIWKKEVCLAAGKSAKQAAEKGNIVHDLLEKYFSLSSLKTDSFEWKLCLPAIDLLYNKFGSEMKWRAEHSFSHSKGFGGKCDLHMLPCEKFPDGVIVDFKTKSAENFSKVKAYDDHCMQLVAYREGFNMSKAECYNLFVGTNKPGDLLLHKWEEKQCKKAWKMFSYLLSYWKESNNF